MKKINQKNIELLTNGEVAVAHSGSVVALRAIIKLAFPNGIIPEGTRNFYFQHPDDPNRWRGELDTELPVLSAKEFFECEFSQEWLQLESFAMCFRLRKTGRHGASHDDMKEFWNDLNAGLCASKYAAQLEKENERLLSKLGEGVTPELDKAHTRVAALEAKHTRVVNILKGHQDRQKHLGTPMGEAIADALRLIGNDIDGITGLGSVPETSPENRYSDYFTPPFRVGRHQKRAVLDSQSHEVVIFPVGREVQAMLYCNYLNSDQVNTSRAGKIKA